MRLAISAAAGLGEGQAEDGFRAAAMSSSRNTRAVRTWVFPVPAEADSAA